MIIWNMEATETLNSQQTRTFKKQFEDDGFIGPLPVMSGKDAVVAARRLPKSNLKGWDKSYAASFPEYYSIASKPEILDVVAAILGDDIMLWGSSLVVRKPGKVHPWHSDIETTGGIGRTVSVWVGLDYVNKNSSLQVISHSHSLGVSIQELRQKEALNRNAITPNQVLSWAKELDSRCKLVACSMKNGDALFFDGNTWHGTDNINLMGTRVALLLQYATPDRPIRIPDFNHLDWPFRFHETPLPPCIMVRGSDTGFVNNIVEPPASSSWIHQLELPLADNPETGWQTHPIYAGSTWSMDWMACHASVLSPGKRPHPPHSHREEEVLVVLDGEAAIMAGQGESQTREILQRGTFVYYPDGHVHTIKNDSDSSITYLMFKWRSLVQHTENTSLPHGTHGIPDPRRNGTKEHVSDWKVNKLFEGPTKYLHKFRAHMSTLLPNGGYEPHSDPYDVALLVLSGTVETIGRSVGPNSVVFYAAGEPHGIRNVGEVNAVYLVFEFHGARTEGHARGILDKLLWPVQSQLVRMLPPIGLKIVRKGLAIIRQFR
ncbi:MAG: cupin domain-containing protein [Balneolales bacterium]